MYNGRNQVLDLGLTVQVNTALQAHWNKKNSDELDYAPSDLREAGLVDPASHQVHNQKYGAEFGSIVNNELSVMRKELGAATLHHSVLSIFAIGKRREWPYFMRKARRYKMKVEAFDLSDVACCGARFRHPQISVHQMQIEGLVGIISLDTLLAFGGNFVQVLNEATKNQVMRDFGKYLKLGQGRRVLLIHPFRKDNNAPVLWKDVKFPKPKWRDSTPYDLEELLEPLEEGLEGPAQLLRMHKGWYYHQCYSAFTLMAA